MEGVPERGDEELETRYWVRSL